MRRRLIASLAFSLIFPLALMSADVPNKSGPATVKSGDWPQWRGPERNAICSETGLLKAWPKGGPKLLWDSGKVNQAKSVGTGISSLAITQGKIFTLGDFYVETKAEPKKDGKGKAKTNKTGDEFVFCYDADTGKELWRSKIGPAFVNGNGHGSRCTPTVDSDRLYAINPHGILACLKTADGTIIWRKDLKKDFGGRMMSGWGYSESPTIDGDKLICTPGGKKAALAALNKITGDVLWTCQPPVDSGAGYSSIVIAEVGGIRQYITLLGKELGLVGVNANTGKFLWNYKKVANGTANIPTAIVHGDLVFASTGYGTGAGLVKLISDGKDGIKAEEEYFLKGKELQNHHGGTVMIGDFIYGGHGNNQGAPFCLAWKTGKLAWGPERAPGGGSAAVLYADGNLYFRYQTGDMVLVEATPKGFTVQGSFRVPSKGNGWPHPVIYHGKLYLRGEDQILCYDIKQ